MNFEDMSVEQQMAALRTLRAECEKKTAAEILTTVNLDPAKCRGELQPYGGYMVWSQSGVVDGVPITAVYHLIMDDDTEQMGDHDWDARLDRIVADEDELNITVWDRR